MLKTKRSISVNTGEKEEMMDNTKIIKIKKIVIEILAVLLIFISLPQQYQALFGNFRVSRIFGAVIALLSFVLLILSVRSSSAIVCSVLCVTALISLFRTSDISFEIVEWICVITTVFLISGLFDSANSEIFLEKLNNHLLLAKILVIIESVGTLALLVTGIGYDSEGFYQGLCFATPTAGSWCNFALTLLLFVVMFDKKNGWKYAPLSLIPCYALFQAGCRSFLIPCAITLILIVDAAVSNKKIKTIVYILSFLFVFFLFINSSMMSKFIAKIGIGDINSFSSGRAGIWKDHINYFLQGNVFEKLFGRTLVGVCSSRGPDYLQSHNDVVYLLAGGGIISLLSYLYILIKPIVKSGFSLIIKMLLFVYLFFPLVMNGGFMYQHFIYSFIFLYFSVLKRKSYKEINEVSGK